MTRHAYLPTLLLSDEGSQYRSEVVAEITQILEIQISHASTNSAQTHAFIKTALKTGTRSVMNYNKSCRKTLGCEPSTVFHGRKP